MGTEDERIFTNHLHFVDCYYNLVPQVASQPQSSRCCVAPAPSSTQITGISLKIPARTHTRTVILGSANSTDTMRHHRESIRPCITMNAQACRVSTAPFNTRKHTLTSTNLSWEQAQKATSRGRRRGTPGDPRPSACGSTTQPEYFGGAR